MSPTSKLTTTWPSSKPSKAQKLITPTPSASLTDGQTIPAEYRELMQDKLWRVTHLYKIRDEQRRIRNLVPNEIQKLIIPRLLDKKPVREFNLKFRQGGVSTLMLLWWLDDTIFNTNTVTGILAHKWESLGHLMDISRLAYQTMPEVFRPRVKTDSKHELSFPDLGSKFFVSLEIRSIAMHNVHISEVCWCETERINATLGATSETSNITMESTANGVGNMGYDLYQDAKLEANGYRALFVPWYLASKYRSTNQTGRPLERTPDERKMAALAKRTWGMVIDDQQLLWRRSMKRKMKDMFPQEYPETDDEAFLTTGGKFFDGRKLLALLREAREYNLAHPPENGDYHVMWEKPQKHHIYVAGADVAEGIGGDYSVLKILCVTCRADAFMLRAHFSVDMFYRHMDHWAREYNKCLLAVERNNHGHAVIQGLTEQCHYPNLYHYTRKMKVQGKDIEEIKYGWDTDRVTKTVMCDQLQAGIEGDPEEDADTFRPEFHVRDEAFLEEGLTFSQQGVKLMAEPGRHDDIVIATAIAFQMYLQERGQMKRSENHGIIVGGKREIPV